MIANLIKNAVESMEGKKGIIEVSYKVKGSNVEISVKDNGRGMSKDVVERIVNGRDRYTTKENGHGIGIQQIKSTTTVMSGYLKIESKENVGTEGILTFPKSEKPKWFADKIEIRKGDTVVILDDELLMHMAWKEKLKLYDKEITAKYFTDGKETVEYLRCYEKRKECFC
jgi:hypothetical protein